MAFAEARLTMEKTLTCPICVGVFTEPVELPCEHNFCKACLSTPEATTNISCRVCNVVHTCDITTLDGNTVLSYLAENWRKWRAEILPNKETRACDICGEMTKLMNFLFCSTCHVAYCPKCKNEFHPSIGVLAEHPIQPLVDTDAMQTESCSLHNKDFVYFCRTCAKPACSEKPCYEQHKDKEHAMEMLPKVYTMERETLTEKVERGRQKVRETNENENEKRLKAFLQKLQEVNDARNKCINESIDVAKQHVEDIRKQLLDEEEATIGNRILNCNAVINEIKSNNSSLETLVSFAEKATDEKEKKVPFLMMSSSLKDELDLYTATDFQLKDDLSSIPTTPDEIDLSLLHGEIESLKMS